MFDIIGDIHGHYSELHRLLDKMGYSYDEDEHIFSHADGRIAVFVGDFIDRGPDNVKVVNLVRNMVDAGHAKAVMGNHEFNAVMWTTPCPKNSGEYSREHSDKNRGQHITFLNEVEDKPDLHTSIIDWFKTLPVYLKLDNVIVVHACWYPSAIKRLQDNGCMTEEGLFTDKGWLASADENSHFFEDIEILLKGPEEKLPDGITFEIPSDKKKSKARVAWWKEQAKTFGDAYASLPDSADFKNKVFNMASSGLHSRKIRNDLSSIADDEIIFIGHFWEQGEPKSLSNKVICVDYSVANGGKLVASRLSKDKKKPKVYRHSNDSFAWVSSAAQKSIKRHRK